MNLVGGDAVEGVQKQKNAAVTVGAVTAASFPNIAIRFCSRNIIALFGEEINGKRKFLTKGVLYRFLINPREGYRFNE